MNTKLKFGILALTASNWLILPVYAASRAAGFPLNEPVKLYIPALAETGDPPTPEPLLLTYEQGKYPLGLHLEILEDPSGELTIEEVSSPEFELLFVPSYVEVPNYGFTDDAYWARLRLDNETRQVIQRNCCISREQEARLLARFNSNE